MSERRFSDDEVAAIFERATSAQRPSQQRTTSATGLTLAQLEQIGSEVGVPAEDIRQAARMVSRGGTSQVRHFLGLPLGVGRTVELERQLTDNEWERLVVDLRETFDARGRVASEGSLRQWSNGNLHALLEPTATGQRVRLRTTNGRSRTFMTGGLAIAAMGVVAVIAGAIGGLSGQPSKLTSIVSFAVVGIGIFAAGALRLPSWARTRQKQMDEVAGRLAANVTSMKP
jgi:hypothetical protein